MEKKYMHGYSAHTPHTHNAGIEFVSRAWGRPGRVGCESGASLCVCMRGVKEGRKKTREVVVVWMGLFSPLLSRSTGTSAHIGHTHKTRMGAPGRIRFRFRVRFRCRVRFRF